MEKIGSIFGPVLAAHFSFTALHKKTNLDKVEGLRLENYVPNVTEGVID